MAIFLTRFSLNCCYFSRLAHVCDYYWHLHTIFYYLLYCNWIQNFHSKHSCNSPSLYERLVMLSSSSLTTRGSADSTALSFSKSILVLYFLLNKIPRSAAVLSEPPLSYVVS